MKKPKQDLGECEMCLNPATVLIGQDPPFRACGLHGRQVRRRLGLECCNQTRIQIRSAMGFLFPDEKLVKERPL